MVWCARESENYPLSEAMFCHWHYGWIHWDEATKSWHSVTSLQLSMPITDNDPEVNGQAPPVPPGTPIKPLRYEPVKALIAHLPGLITYADGPQQEGPHPQGAQQEGAQGGDPQ